MRFRTKLFDFELHPATAIALVAVLLEVIAR